jgi:hypothetical protein
MGVGTIRSQAEEVVSAQVLSGAYNHTVEPGPRMRVLR